jgi:hypothetical protein
MLKTQEFIAKLNEVDILLSNEQYESALTIIDQLKEIEKEGDFDYNLIHRLYQMDSNVRSLLNQKRILEVITSLMKGKKEITLQNVGDKLNKNFELTLDPSILLREVELLILRGLLSCKVKGNTLYF